MVRSRIEEEGVRLDRAVEHLLAQREVGETGRVAARQLIGMGAVQVDGRVCRSCQLRLRPGTTIEIQARSREVRSRKPRRFEGTFELAPQDIRFEDEGLLVVRKPAGLPTHETLDPGRAHLHGAVRRYLSGSGSGYAGLHHRLDVQTSGLVLFTKDPRLNAEVSRWFRTHAIAKTYLAWVCRAHVDGVSAWTVENYLGRRQERPTRMGAVRAGGDPAQTSFRWLTSAGALDSAWLVEARPRTGRMHQIRVHLAEGGTPICGDELYGGPVAPRLMLHAWVLEFPHPVTGSTVRVEDVPPADFGPGHIERPQTR